ncbi:MAG TPA: FAD-binding oxidoreductase [Nocardioidaceae bacterium]|nr:FAD-binding oxidoreductase [Nocardioidaceae bacterium]
MTTTSSPLSPHAEALSGLCGGAVHFPGDPGYDAARLPWNVAVDQRPAAVAVPRTVDDVVAVVRGATSAGLRVAPQSTGHGAAPLPEHGLADVVLVRLHDLNGVTVDVEGRSARVVGGTLWRDVVAATAPHGLTALHGSSPDVAVAGYVLGGGLSFYSRQHGLATNSITALEVVLSDGSLVRASSGENPDLFWALRGGGGNLGIVVALEFDLLPVPDVYAGMLLWDLGHAPQVLRTWRDLTRTAPDTVTTSLRLMSFPPLPELPPFLSGRRLVVVDGAVLEDDETAAALLTPLRALAPEIDTFGRMPVAGLLDVHMDPPGPTPAVSDHAVLHSLDDEAVDALLSAAGPDSASPLLFAELRHLGGALSRPAAGAGALATLPGEYSLFCVAVAPVPEAVVAGQAAAAEVVQALAPWSMSAKLLNFAEAAVDTSSGFEAEAWARLVAVRNELDPHRTMVAAHPI